MRVYFYESVGGFLHGGRIFEGALKLVSTNSNFSQDCKLKVDQSHTTLITRFGRSNPTVEINLHTQVKKKKRKRGAGRLNAKVGNGLF